MYISFVIILAIDFLNKEMCAMLLWMKWKIPDPSKNKDLSHEQGFEILLVDFVIKPHFQLAL